jgi:glyoxylase-like metal-dependent hydrolase (beta-lactamase superfamily II)
MKITLRPRSERQNERMPQVGSVTVTALLDAEGPFVTPREEAFPEATAEQWAAADAFDPQARGAGGEWWLRFRSFAISYGHGPATLVDAGIGPAGSLACDWAPVPGRLPAELEKAGIDPSEVDTIVLTHLHNDHMGWAVPRDSPFTNARVIVQQADVAVYALNRDKTGQYDLLIEPLRSQGRLQVIDGHATLGRDIKIIPTPGHTPGHQSVLVGDEMLITGDLLVHAVQLLHPDVAYANEMDPGQARETRRRILNQELSLAVSHLGRPYT